VNKVLYDGSPFSWDSTFRALGLKAGVDYFYGIADDLEIYAKAHGSLVANASRFAAGLHLALGFLYHQSLCGFDIGLKAGYEMIAWHGVDAPLMSASTFGLQGLTAGLQLRF
jgi:hypothetical protein